MEMSWILSAALGIGLATAVGFRVFLPLLALGLAVYTQAIPVAESWEWVGSAPALILLATATVAEILGYYIPWVDNLLDTLAIPLAAIAGTLVMLVTLVDVDPYITWSLAIIAGGGTAALVAGSTGALRATSSATTGGLGNPIVSTLETVTSGVVTVLAIVFPIVAIIVCCILVFFLIRFWKRWRKKRQLKN